MELSGAFETTYEKCHNDETYGIPKQKRSGFTDQWLMRWKIRTVMCHEDAISSLIKLAK